MGGGGGGGGGGDLTVQTTLVKQSKITENKGEITETYRPVKSFTNIYRNLLQEYVYFFGGCNSFANKTGWVHKQEFFVHVQ